MSWHFLLESEEVCSEHLPAGFIPFAPSSLTRLPAASSSPVSVTGFSPASLSGMTCAPSTAPHGEEGSMLFPGGFPAKTSQSLVSGSALKVPSPGSGGTLPESLKKSSRASFSLRTRQTSEPLDLTLCSATLPASGSMQSGKCSEQPTSALRIGGTACGYWATQVPTPSTTNYGCNIGGGSGRVGKVRPSIDEICRGQVPTPTTRSNWPMNGPTLPDGTRLKVPAIDEICRGQLQTPTTKGNEWAPSMAKHKANLNLQVHLSGRCSLAVREWLMGWPDGWTALEPLEMGKWQEWQQQHGPNFWSALIAAASGDERE